MIDTSTWKDFVLGDLFDIKLPSARSEKNYEEGDVNYVSSGAFNNGVANHLKPKDGEELDKGHCITVSPLDGSAFWQKDDFMGRGGSGASISMLYNDNLNDLRALFICSVIRNTAQKFGYSDLLNSKNLRTLNLKLPATPDGQPDWGYMESYIKAVMEESEKSLENLKKADDTKHLIDVSGWGEFRVGDLFNVSRPIARSSQKYEKGDMAFVASGCFNNGVTDYLEPKDENDYDEGNCLTVSPVDGYTFYQKNRFLGRGGAGSSIIILRNNMLNELRGKYLSTVIRFACKAWDYANMGNKDKLADTMISLPIDANGEPDWQYMEDYVKQIMDKSEQIISDLQIGA